MDPLDKYAGNTGGNTGSDPLDKYVGGGTQTQTPQQSPSEMIWHGLANVGNAITGDTGGDIAAGIGGGKAIQQGSDISQAQSNSDLAFQKAMQARQKAGLPLTPTEQKLQKEIQGRIGQSSTLATDQFPSLNKSNEQVAGDFTQLAGNVVGAGSLPGVGGDIGAATSVGKGILAGAKSGALTGTAFGAASGVASGMQQNQDTGGLLKSGAIGAATGAVTGGVLGGATGGIFGGIKGAQLKKQQLTDALTSNPELVAKYSLNDSGKIVKDPQASELIRQGVPEKQVAVIKNAAPEDKAKFQQMIQLADTASKNARATERPTDVVGQTIVGQTKNLVSQLQSAGKAVDRASTALKGVSVDPTPAADQFLQGLQKMGVSFDEKGVPQFANSDIEGIKPAENLITRIAQRAKNVQDDGASLHQFKRFLDEQVNFSKEGEGLTGQTENVVKGLRHNIDSTLDGQNPQYDAANTAYKKAIDLMDQTKTVLGKNFNPSSGTVRAGSIARRILGNSANRGDILEYLRNLQDYTKKTGGQTGGDVISQTVMADILDDVYGTQATTGFQGGVQRGVEGAMSAGKSFMSGHPIEAGMKVIGQGINAARNINPEAKINALKAMLGDTAGKEVSSKAAPATESILTSAKNNMTGSASQRGFLGFGSGGGSSKAANIKVQINEALKNQNMLAREKPNGWQARSKRLEQQIAGLRKLL